VSVVGLNISIDARISFLALLSDKFEWTLECAESCCNDRFLARTWWACLLCDGARCGIWGDASGELAFDRMSTDEAERRGLRVEKWVFDPKYASSLCLPGDEAGEFSTEEASVS
jgi:hypothetical protein